MKPKIGFSICSNKFNAFVLGFIGVVNNFHDLTSYLKTGGSTPLASR
jgi:hypothetical protein